MPSVSVYNIKLNSIARIGTLSQKFGNVYKPIYLFKKEVA